MSFKEFLKPNLPKIIVSVIFVIYFILIVTPSYIWNFPILPPFVFLFEILQYELYFLFIITIFPVLLTSYLMSCFFVYLFSKSRKNKILLSIFIVFIIIFFGIDEPLFNNTINRPNYFCNANSDCVIKSTSDSMCGKYTCLNKEWNKYNSLIENVFAYSCVKEGAKVCECQNNKCVGVSIKNVNNVSLCLEDQDKQNRNYCLLDIARRLNSTEICHKMDDNYLNFLCLAEQGDLTICSNNDYSCFIKAAGLSGNEEFCHQIPQNTSKDDCFLEVVTIKKIYNYTFCDDITDQKKIMKCYYEVIWGSKRISENNPYGGVIYDLNPKEKFCEYSLNSDICYYGLATVYLDPSLCDFLEIYEKECKEFINQGCTTGSSHAGGKECFNPFCNTSVIFC